MPAQLDYLAVRLRPFRAITRLVNYALFEGRPVTTKGRWLNIVVFTFLRVLNRLPATGRVTDQLFIIGMGRSGTTALGRILGLHKDIGFLNEPKALWHMISHDGDIIGNYTASPARYRLNAEHTSPDMIDRARRLYGWCRTLNLCRRILDKYPELVFRVPYILTLFPNAKFIFLVRNGWDTCASIDSWSERNRNDVGDERHDWWGRNRRKWNTLVDEIVAGDKRLRDHSGQLKELTNQRIMAAVEWVVSMNEGLKWMAEKPDNIIMIRYEDLVREPEVIINKILDFSSIARDRVVVDYAKKILSPLPAKKDFQMPDYLQEYFDDVMHSLGYGVSI